MDWLYWDDGLVVTCIENGQAKTFSCLCLTVLACWDQSREDEQREAILEFSFIIISLERFQNLSEQIVFSLDVSAW